MVIETPKVIKIQLKFGRYMHISPLSPPAGYHAI